jgi:hypothetical protein
MQSYGLISHSMIIELRSLNLYSCSAFTAIKKLLHMNYGTIDSGFDPFSVNKIINYRLKNNSAESMCYSDGKIILDPKHLIKRILTHFRSAPYAVINGEHRRSSGHYYPAVGESQ